MDVNELSSEKLKEIANHYRELSQAKIQRYTSKNQSYEKYFKITGEYYDNHEQTISFDLQNALSEYSGDNKKEDETSSEHKLHIVKDEKYYNERLILTIEIHVFYRLFKMRVIEEKTVERIEDISIRNDGGTGRFCWYRGQTNSDWALVPSFFRNPKTTYLCKWSHISADYGKKPKSKPLIKKLEEVNIHSVYRTAAFIQHSIGYSPLIDFTKSSFVATSFALANFKSMVDFYGTSSCVYELDKNGNKTTTSGGDADGILRNIEIWVFKENELIVNLIENERWLNFLDNKEKSVIYLIDFPTNDRMFFQKGTFILFDRVIIIGNNIYMSYEEGKPLGPRLTKYIIEPKVKEDMYAKLMEGHPQYHQRYLYDPYLYLSEPDK